MTKEHEHRFARLSDEAIFCDCGEIRTADDATCGHQHYPLIVWPSVPYTVPTYPTYPWWQVTSGTTTVTGGLKVSSTYTGGTS